MGKKFDIIIVPENISEAKKEAIKKSLDKYRNDMKKR